MAKGVEGSLVLALWRAVIIKSCRECAVMHKGKVPKMEGSKDLHRQGVKKKIFGKNFGLGFLMRGTAQSSGFYM